jgi:hypothetical protein
MTKKMFEVSTSYVASKTYLVYADSIEDAENKVLNNENMDYTPSNGDWNIDNTIETSNKNLDNYDVVIK